MNNSESIKTIAQAFVLASSEVKNMIPDSKGYGYNYTSLGCIIDQIKPILSEHGLCFIQSPAENENSLGIETVMLHNSGEYLSFVYNIPITNMKGANNTQQAGAAITYGRRYALSAIFGIATDTDTDASSKQGKPAKVPTPEPVKDDPFKADKGSTLTKKIKDNIALLGKHQVLTEDEKAEFRGKYGKCSSHQEFTELSTEIELAIRAKGVDDPWK